MRFLGSHQVAKLQHMVENTRQRLMDLKHSQKNVDRNFNSLQVKYSIRTISCSIIIDFRLNTTKPNMILMKHIISIDN